MDGSDRGLEDVRHNTQDVMYAWDMRKAVLIVQHLENGRHVSQVLKLFTFLLTVNPVLTWLGCYCHLVVIGGWRVGW